MRAAILASSCILVGSLAGCGERDSVPALPAPDAAVRQERIAERRPPIALPDPCSLLSPDEALALLTRLSRAEYEAEWGALDLTPIHESSGYEHVPLCNWGNGSVKLTVLVVQPGELDAETEAALVRAQQKTALDYWPGELVANVGDGAKIHGGMPIEINAVRGRWTIRLSTHATDEAAGRLAETARLVFGRLGPQD